MTRDLEVKQAAKRFTFFLFSPSIFSQSPFIKISDVQTSLLVNTQYFLYCVVVVFYKKNPLIMWWGVLPGKKTAQKVTKNPIYLQKEIFFSPSSLYL